MPLLIATTLLVSWGLQTSMQHAFYPVLLLVLLGASLGVPIPEDVPLIAAGVILAHQPGVATWGGTLSMALLGIMCGDVVLYVLGKRWGPEACQHRWVNWLITPERLGRMTRNFNRYGMWMCFFSRFFMGVRAAMCVTAGVTRLSFWRFVLADLSGALLSIPLFVWLGYWFASAVPTLKAYVHLVQWALLVLAVAILVAFVLYRRHRPQKAPTGDDAVSTPMVTAQKSSPLDGVSPTRSSKRGNSRPAAETCR